MNQELSPHNAEPSPFWRSRYAIGLVIMGAIATYFLLSEHRAHFLGALPLLLLLSCPLVHVFMHRGHGGHGDGHAHHHGGESTSKPPTEARLPTAGDRP
ncbi:DUF2933 domain-containing protein [Variovorax paradoxus]|jgi:hypothetical protein|uniref:DUF2933 domain-containing protein n=1 Tax=Variovorax paradoxus TaxID=34073 RepID=UPI0009BCD0C7|nr:DUF2933 domain-containing protein [Variovorax paradoxus]